jgi:hypothetical protein
MERKLYPCKECGAKVPIRSKGLCPPCREMQRRSQGEETMLTRKTPIKKSFKVDKERKEKLSKFFEAHINFLKSNPFCFETGERIYDPSRLNIAHLFPKRKYHSVEDHSSNVVYLSWDAHTRFDRLVDTNNFDRLQKEFPKSFERMKKVLHLVEEKGLLKTKLEEWLLHYDHTNNRQ